MQRSSISAMMLVTILMLTGCSAGTLSPPLTTPNSNSTDSPSPAPAPDPDPEYFAESFDLSSYQKKVCATFNAEDKKLKKATKYIAKVAKSVGKDKYKAFSERKKKDFKSSSTVVAGFSLAIEGSLKDQMNLALKDSGYSQTDYLKFSSLYFERWSDESLKSCKKLDAYKSGIKSSTKAEGQVNIINKLADAKPWYPKGFKAVDSDFAWKSAKYRCGYFSRGCASFQLYSSKACSSLYVNINWFNKKGVLLGNGIESFYNVKKGQKMKVVIDSYDSSATKYQVSDINCYNY